MIEKRVISAFSAWALLAFVTSCSASNKALSTDKTAITHLSWALSKADAATLTIEVLHGQCDDGPHVKLTEDSQTVRIEATTTTEKRSCPAVGVVTLVAVRIAAPLGSRALDGCNPLQPGQRTDCRTFRY